MFIALTVLLASTALAAPQTLSKGVPKKSGGGMMGSLANMMGLDPSMEIGAMVCKSNDGTSKMGAAISNMFGSPNGNGPDEQCVVDRSGGSGKYKAKYVADASIANHTIYAPEVPPVGEKLPVIIWGNGFCMAAGTMFANFLNEIASHGYFIVANGPAVGNQLGGQTSYKDLITSIDWVTKGDAAKKYGNIDTSKLLVAGQSCGGLEAYSATTSDPRVKMTALFNSGYLQGSTKASMAKFKHPVAWFLGGKKDIAEKNGLMDYKNLPDTIPGLVLDSDIGHIGTYYQKYGGKMGRAAVAYFDWQLKGDQSKKALFCSPGADSALVKDGFTMQSKNGFC